MTKESLASIIAPRAELSRFQSYQPGLSIEQIKRQFGLKSVVKLASNENSMGPSKKVIKAYNQASDRLFRYPETRSIELRGVIAEKYQLDLSNVIVGNGSDELIELLAKAFLTPQDDIVVSASSFIQYRIAANLMGANIITVPMRELKHDLARMANAVTLTTKFVFIANPNNPTGTHNTKREVEEFLGLLPARVVPVFDEAYFEYASVHLDYPSMIEDYYRKRPMVVLRTFSKIHGLAGLRVGYAVAPEVIVRELDKIRPPFNVTTPSQYAAVAALRDIDHIKKSVALNEKEKAFLVSELSEMGFEVVPSSANFLLFRVFPRKGRAMFDDLLHKGVIVRAVDEYGLSEYLRVTVGDRSENKKFLEVLREVLKAS